MMAGRMLMFAFAALLVFASAEARAASPKAQIEKGIRLREAGRDAEALELFRSAYAASKSPRALAQIALAEQALGRWVEAERHLVTALGTKNRWIARYRAPLEGALETIRERLATLTVAVPGVEGAEIRVNGADAGRSPLPAPVTVVAGSVVVEVRAEGYWPMSRRLELQARARARERFALVPKPVSGAVASTEARKAASSKESPASSAALASSASEAPGVGTSGGAGSARVEKDVGLSAERPSTGGPELTLPAYLAAGGAVAAAGIGVAFLFVRNGRVDTYNGDACLEGGRTRDENCGDELAAANDAEAIMTGAFVGAGVLGVTAAVLFLLDGPDAPTVSGLGPGPGELGASWRVNF